MNLLFPDIEHPLPVIRRWANGLLLGGFACQLTQGAGSGAAATAAKAREARTNAAATVLRTGSALLGRCTHYRRA
jgi:hypothetical protein